jgi:hypothetical protein
MMKRPVRCSVLTAVIVLAVVVSAGCGSYSAAPGVLRMAADTRSKPCALLGSAQLRQLRFSAGRQEQATDGLGGVVCLWTGYPVAKGPIYTGRLLDGPVPGGTRSVSINNLRTAQYLPPGVDQRTSCGFLISVASGRTLVVQFADPKGYMPGLSHLVACQKAQAAACDMTSTLTALQS